MDCKVYKYYFRLIVENKGKSLPAYVTGAPYKAEESWRDKLAATRGQKKQDAGRKARRYMKTDEEHSQEWLCHKGKMAGRDKFRRALPVDSEGSGIRVQ